MKQIRYIVLGLLTSMTVTFTGCSSDYLDTMPTDKVPEEIAASSLQNLYVNLNGIHRKMVAQDSESQGMGGEPGFAICREALGDDMTWESLSWHQTLLQWVAHRNEKDGYDYRTWRIYYGWILNANFILQNVDEFKNHEDQQLYRAVKGEALCFRAFSHFMLVQTYGKRYQAGTTNSQLGVPYRMTPTLEPMARNTVEECYTNINKDLDEAIVLLEGYEAKDINHFTSKVVMGIKARVALAQQDYATAADLSDKAIKLAEKSGQMLMNKEQLMNGFADITTDTKEALWAAMTQADQTVYFYSFYAYMSWNFNASAVRSGIKAINNLTYDKMSETDLRRQWWDPSGKAEVPNSSFIQIPYQNRKFTARSMSNAVGDYAFMRLAELYLMKAEALAHLGKTAEAQDVLTAFALTRDPEYKAKGNAGAALVEEIMTQRRIELWGEGFRWFDLKRLDLAMDRTGSNFDDSFCNILQVPAGDARWQYAIPKEELDANPLMVRNE